MRYSKIGIEPVSLREYLDLKMCLFLGFLTGTLWTLGMAGLSLIFHWSKGNFLWSGLVMFLAFSVLEMAKDWGAWRDETESRDQMLERRIASLEWRVAELTPKQEDDFMKKFAAMMQKTDQ